MILKILMLINLLGYAFVVSQPLFYLLAMSSAQKNMDAPAYVELRNLLDRNLMVRYKMVYYITLLSTLLVCVFTMRQPAGLLFITSLIACIALWIDVFLMLKGNIPLNKFIQTWTPQQYPANWQEYRAAWFRCYEKRQVADVVGFVSLAVGLVFGH